MIQLTITYDGNTIDLQADGYTVLDEYLPNPGGGEKAVSDRFDLAIIASSAADLDVKIRALELAFEYAAAHPRGPEAAWINYAPAQGESTWRSRLTGGTVMLASGFYKRRKQDKSQVGVAITRLPWWEGPEAQVPLTNSNGTNNTSGLAVYNHMDSGTGHDNYVEIAATDVDGGLPGAVRLELTNPDTSGNGPSQIFAGHNWQSDPANFNPVLEGEAATGGTTTVDTTCSNGNYSAYSLAANGETVMYTWTLSSALLGQAKGHYFKIIGRFKASYGVVRTRFKPYLFYNNVVPIWEGSDVLPDSAYARALRDLGMIRLPPWLPGVSSLSALSLRLSGKRIVSESLSIGLDFLYLLPVDTYHQYTVIGHVLDNGRLIDDGINGMIYTDDGADGNRQGNVVGSGSGIYLEPGKLQRIYFLFHCALADSAPVDRTLSVKLYYRPRRATI